MGREKELWPEHRADFEKSGLNSAAIAAAEVWSVSRKEIRDLLGFCPSAVESGVAIPYGHGFVRVKLFPSYRDAEGHRVKYLQPKDTGARVYIPKSTRKLLRDPDATIHIVEGEKKAMRMAQDGLCCIGLSGIWNWKDKGSDKLIREIHDLPLDERRVRITPDSDVQDNPNIRLAVVRLWEALRKRHARVRVILLPRPDTGKIGVDDYLQKSSLAEFKRLPTIRRQNDLPIPPPINKRANGVLTPVSFGKLKEPPPAEPVMGGLIAKNHSTTIYGDGGQGKSLIAMAIGLAFARGKKFLDHPLPKGRVLYLDWELSQEQQLRRAFQLSRGMGYSRPPKRFTYLTPEDFIGGLVPKLKKLIAKRKHVLIVFDSMGPACGVSPEVAEEVMKVFLEIKSLGVSCLLVDHQSKMQEGHRAANKTPFGSAYKYNLSRSVIHLTKVGAAPDLIKVMMRHTKNNFGGMHENIALKITFSKKKNGIIKIRAGDVMADAEFRGRQSAADQIVYSLTKDGDADTKLLSESTNLPEKTIANRLPRMEKEGVVRVVKKSGRKQIWGIVKAKGKAS